MFACLDIDLLCVSLAPNVAKMDKKAGREIEELMNSVCPEGFATPAAAKRATTGGAAGGKRPKVDPSQMDAKQLALSGGVSVSYFYKLLFGLLEVPVVHSAPLCASFLRFHLFGNNVNVDGGKRKFIK